MIIVVNSSLPWSIPGHDAAMWCNDWKVGLETEGRGPNVRFNTEVSGAYPWNIDFQRPRMQELWHTDINGIMEARSNSTNADCLGATMCSDPIWSSPTTVVAHHIAHRPQHLCMYDAWPWKLHSRFHDSNTVWNLYSTEAFLTALNSGFVYYSCGVFGAILSVRNVSVFWRLRYAIRWLRFVYALVHCNRHFLRFVCRGKVPYGPATVTIRHTVVEQGLKGMGAVGFHFVGHWCH